MDAVIFARTVMVFLFPAAGVFYVRSVYRVFGTAVEALGEMQWWSLSPVLDHPLDHVLLMVLAPVIAGCVTWARHFDGTLIEAFVGKATLAGVMLSIMALAMGVIFMNLFGAAVMLGTASGLMLLASVGMLYVIAILLF